MFESSYVTETSNSFSVAHALIGNKDVNKAINRPGANFPLRTSVHEAIGTSRSWLKWRRIKVAPKGVERTRHYLIGRGLGQLQADILIDLASGEDLASVYKKNVTTPTTVYSYQTRAFEKLGLNGIDELRKLLKD